MSNTTIQENRKDINIKNHINEQYDYKRTVKPLLTWFHQNARTLRWRSNPKPYYVWVSEIMLQQTRVEAVKAYFDRFVDTLPEIKDLALVEEEKLVKLWEGLGYYNRVRNLKKAAIIVMEEYGGELPADYEALLKLPGIGSYTAGAIASIAYGIKRPSVDGNVLRVAKRLAGSYDDITKASVKKQLEEELLEVMPSKNPGDYNQALMELGAVVCLPNGKPLCGNCPLSSMCIAYQKNIMMELPVKPTKKARKIEEKTVFLLEHKGAYAINRRAENGLLPGLWEFPNINGKLSVDKVEKRLEELGIHDYEMELLGEAKHVFSHIEWHMIGYRIRLKNSEPVNTLGSKSLENNILGSKPLESNIVKSNPLESDRDVSMYRVISGLVREEENYQAYTGVGDFVWVNPTKLEQEYAIPTAFIAYRKQI